MMLIGSFVCCSIFKGQLNFSVSHQDSVHLSSVCQV